MAETTTGPGSDLREWGREREMTAFEALMWRAEADPTLRSHVTAVEILDCAPDWERLVAAHDWGTRMVPRFRDRVVEPLLGLGPPAWAADKNFNLGYHLRRVALPAPGSFRQLLDLAETLAMPPLDPARPLWEAVLVEGLEGGRAAYVLKLHHTLTDGMGAIQLLERLHSRRREPTTDKPQPPPPEPESPGAAGVLAGQIASRLGAAPGAAGRLAAGALGGRALYRGLARPDRAVGEAVHFARSLHRVLAPPPVAGSPLLAGRSLSWHFEALDMPLADLRAAAKAGGGSVNDAFLAAVLGAFRRYHEHCGVEIETMPVAIPISIRAGDHPMGGNRIAGARFAAPVGEPDPRERIRLVREFVLTARAEPAIDALNLLAPVMSRLPGSVVTELGRRSTHANDLQASNVPGIGHPVYIAGARVTHMYPFGPLPGCAAMVVLVSHDGTCCLGANVDPAAVTDTDLFATCLREGFDEILALAGTATPPDTGAQRMTIRTEWELTGARGRIVVSEWPNDEARYVVLLAHGHGEHVGRYDHVARALVGHGAVVYAPDHLGHGKSEGERVLIEDLDDLVSDLQAVAERVRSAHPDLPVVLLGHSMGGIVATRYAQRNGAALAALVLSGPVIGGNPAFEALLEMDPIPDVPIPPEALSRDPEVGRAYAEDPLVWHGPFKRPTLEAVFAAIAAIAAGPSLGSLPTLWIHGENDALAPLEQTREAIARVRGDQLDERIYPGAQHEVLNETNKDEVLADVTAFVDRVLTAVS